MIRNHMVEIPFIHNNHASSKILAIIGKFSKTLRYHKWIKKTFCNHERITTLSCHFMINFLNLILINIQINDQCPRLTTGWVMYFLRVCLHRFLTACWCIADVV